MKRPAHLGRVAASLALAGAGFTGIAVHADSASAAAKPAVTADTKYCPYTVSTAVNIRYSPSTSSTIMGVWYPGQTKYVQYPFVKSGSWVKIGSSRWVYGTYLRSTGGRCLI